MAGERDGIIGHDEPLQGDGAPTRGGFAEPGPIGLKGGGGVRFIDRKIAKVTGDWTPPSVSVSQVSVSGKTLADVAAHLNALPEWGKGGGKIWADSIPAGSSPTVDASLHAAFFKQLPDWSDYSGASPAARANWDSMLAALDAHEQGHVDIAIKVADELLQDLPGKSIDDLDRMVNATTPTMKTRHDAFDTKTDHGKNTGVVLDISIK
jgi:hypothetical protein